MQILCRIMNNPSTFAIASRQVKPVFTGPDARLTCLVNCIAVLGGAVCYEGCVQMYSAVLFLYIPSIPYFIFSGFCLKCHIYRPCELFFKISVLVLWVVTPCELAGEYQHFGPNVLVDWLTLLPRLREVPNSNLNQDTGCHDWGFTWFFSVPPGEYRKSNLN
jgi:hypothetical protein